MNNLYKSVIFIILGMLLFVFSPTINAYLVSIIFGKQWDLALWSSFVIWPSILIGSIVLIIVGLRLLRIYFKNKKSETEIK